MNDYYDELTELIVSESQLLAKLYEVEFELNELKCYWKGLWRWDCEEMEIERENRMSELLDYISALKGRLEIIQMQRSQVEGVLHLCDDD